MILEKVWNKRTLMYCTSRWWWPTLFPMRCRSCSVQKSKLWMWVWSWLRPSGASTTESPWPICSATSLWMTEATHTYIPVQTNHTRPSTHEDQVSTVYFSLLFNLLFLLDTCSQKLALFTVCYIWSNSNSVTLLKLHSGTVQTIQNMSLK